MPRIVDHDARRREIADALWRVVRRDGLHAASVRVVAVEAGWSPSATRHYFATQDDVLLFAMQLVEERVRARVAAVEPTGDVLADVRAALCEVLPLDRQRREDNEVWLALSARAQVEPALRAMRVRAHEGLRGLAGSAVRALVDAGLTGDIDLEIETDRLHAVIDGLAVHAAIRPRIMNAARILNTLDRHLAELTRRTAMRR